MNTKRLFLIGGGEIKDKETEIIDSIFIQSVKEKKNFVFLPTASGDAEGYIATVKDVFATHFGGRKEKKLPPISYLAPLDKGNFLLCKNRMKSKAVCFSSPQLKRSRSRLFPLVIKYI